MMCFAHGCCEAGVVSNTDWISRRQVRRSAVSMAELKLYIEVVDVFIHIPKPVKARIDGAAWLLFAPLV
jgi:hypothetical protein